MASSNSSRFKTVHRTIPLASLQLQNFHLHPISGNHHSIIDTFQVLFVSMRKGKSVQLVWAFEIKNSVMVAPFKRPVKRPAVLSTLAGQFFDNNSLAIRRFDPE
jgi:hypothetical protein